MNCLDYFAQIKPLIEDLKTATQAQDWDRVSQLDDNLRQQIKDWVAAPHSERDNEELTTVLKRLQTIIALVQQGAQKHLDELQQELSRFSKDQKAAAVYRDSDRF